MMKRLLFAALLLAACGDGAVDPDDLAIVRVELAPDTAEIALGDTLRMQALAYDRVGPVLRRITWTSSNPSIATVDSLGTVRTKTVGTVTIRATAEQVTGEAQLTVATWDLMFFSLAGGTFAETLVLPPNSGGVPERIFPVGRFAMDAAPSPDGARIAYAVRDVEGYTDIWVANRDGSGARLLVTGEGNDEWPSWSPDGNRIAFQSERGGALNDIWVINADGTGLQRLTTDPLPAVTQEIQPVWSPDGTRIAFAGNGGGTYDIYTIKPDGTDLKRITSSVDSELEPGWSPDGTRFVARVTTTNNEWDIVVLRTDGVLVRHIPLPGWQRSPSWRPDGKSITFSSQAATGQPWQVWTVNPDGTNAQQQTSDSFTGGHRPVWLRRR